MDLSVIIVNYNVKHYIEQCIKSVLWCGRTLDLEVIVVDNDSHDGSVEYLRERFGNRITVIPSSRNLGFSKANNVGIRASSGDFVLLLNPDTIVTESSLCDTLAFMRSHPTAGGLGVRMLTSEGFSAPESRRGLPSPMTSFYKMVGLCAKYPNHKRFGRYYMSGISWDEHQIIDVISGAFCMLRREALFKVGLLDEDYFMYGEDIELSTQLQAAGFVNWYYPSFILHYKGESTYKSSFRYVHVFYKAMLIFFRKHYQHYSFLLTLPIKCAIVAKALLVGCRIAFDALSNRDEESLRLRESESTQYIFIGTEFSLATCREIAKRRGLSARFIEGTIGTLPQGHLQPATCHLPPAPTVVVYDTSAYSHADIFRIFSSCPQRNVSMGTFDSYTRKIITQKEVIV